MIMNLLLVDIHGSKKRFRLWHYKYNKSMNAFNKNEYDSIYEDRFGKIVFAGDAKDRLNKELRTLLKENTKMIILTLKGKDLIWSHLRHWYVF